MPTRAFTAMELDHATVVLEAIAAGLFDDSDSDRCTSDEEGDDLDETVMIVCARAPACRARASANASPEKETLGQPALVVDQCRMSRLRATEFRR